MHLCNSTSIRFKNNTFILSYTLKFKLDNERCLSIYSLS